MKKILITIIVILLVGFTWYFFSLRPVDSRDENQIALTVESGMSVRQIADRLEEMNLIRSPRAFMIYTKLHGVEKNLEAGKFAVRPSMKVSEIVEVLKHGFAEEMVITIPEGFTVLEIDELLKSKGVIEGGEVVACANECDFETFEFLPGLKGLAPRGGRLEGYLFPETYYIEVDEFVPKFFLERMLGTFRKRILKDFDESGRSLHEIITMASLIEEEARKDEERGMISGILWKRYDKSMGLGVDATVRYIINKPTGAITTADLNYNSSYNTRKFRGLPPGPIANPGEKSIKASVNPEENEYGYYLHGNDGEIRYAETNVEHNLNKFEYLK